MKIYKKIIIILTLSFIISCHKGVTIVNDKQLSIVIIKGEELQVEVADTPEERELGLMFRESLPQNSGMLFVFPQPMLVSFWMKNTSFPLSIAFINEDRIIVQIEDMEPYSLNSHRSFLPVKYALEVNQGWFNSHNVVVGDRVDFKGY